MSTFRKRTRFSGRIAELNSMDSAFRDVSGGRQHCILLAAEAGGGKSRLVEEFTKRLSGRALILKGGC
ncbi:AAA family ATPase [Rhizobium sp. 13T]|uniref:AAA family ATPase n=1 Tax=Rhizobium croatiense TaxID=2867516 RepID=A0ABS7M2R1_9HYPH|nr:AAA family ATPase [Rhizobium croatiense]